MALSVLFLLPLSVPLVGCDADPVSTASSVEPDVSGTWAGTSDGITLEVTLVQAEDGTVSGSGTLTTRELNVPVTVVEGFHAFPNLRLELRARGFEALEAKGWVLGSSRISTRLISSTYAFYTSPADGDSSTNCVLLLTPVMD